MSIEEQDAIMGKAHRNKRAAEREIAALMEQARGWGSSLEKLGRFLNGLAETKPEPSPYGRDLPHLEGYPTAEKIADLMADYSAAVDRKRRAEKVLEKATISLTHRTAVCDDCRRRSGAEP